MASIVQTLSGQDGGTDLDLDEVWSRAIEEYEQTTETSLKRNLRGFDAVADDINERLRKSKATNTAKAQQIMGTAMKCLQRFGGIIAQATGVVFGPSAQCWNAISFVISAAQGYQAVLDGFAALMERCTVFLERLNIDLEAKRQSGVPFDRRLRKSTYQIIAHFFTALGHSYKLANSKRQKFKTVFKIVLFNDDSGVSGSLTGMETMIRDLTDTKVSVILQDVQGLARYVRESEEEINRNQEKIRAGIERIEQGVERTETAVVQIQIDLNKKMTQEESEKNLKTIVAALRLNDKEPWHERHGDLSSHRMAGTGQWLLQPKTTLPSWVDIHRDGVKIVTLTGKSGFGKSHLASVIIDHLLEKYPRGSSGAERASIAYYYFQNTSEENLARALGSIVYQFAKSDRTYAKTVAAACGKSVGLSNPDELWQRLVIDLQRVMQGTYFVILDGLKADSQDEKVKEAFTKLIEAANSTSESRSIRLFVSSQETELPSPVLTAPGIARIALGASERQVRPGITRTRSRLNELSSDETGETDHSLWNREDVEVFARTKLAAMCSKKPYLASTLQDPELKAAEVLARGVKGNYTSLQLKLDQIEASDNVEDILTVINEASVDPAELLRRDVDSLNDSLTSDEILELNDLLLWVSGSFEPTPLALLKAALGDKTLWLEKHIPQKYYQLLKYDESINLVETRRSAETMSILQAKDEAVEGALMTARPAARADIGLQANEIELVERVIRTFCGDLLFDKFGFQSFFQSKTVKRNVRIEVPTQNAIHTRLMRRCLESLCQDQDDDFYEPLQTYAVGEFMDHLDCIDLNLADRGDLRAIGSLLLRILSDEKAVHTWFSDDYEEFLGPRWFNDNTYAGNLAQCLKHPLVQAGYKDAGPESDRLQEDLKQSVDGYEALQCIAEILAKRWFSKVRESGVYFYWPYFIMAKVWNVPYSNEPAVSDLQRYFDWARGLSIIDISSSQWSFRAASILLLSEHYREALDLCHEVKLEGAKDWPVLLKTAEIHIALSNFKEALECLHQVKGYREELMEVDDEYANYFWHTTFMKEALLHRDLKDFDAAEACLREILNGAPLVEQLGARQEAATHLFKLWDERDAHHMALDLVQQWMSTTQDSERAASWFLRLAEEDDFHKCLISAGVKRNQYSEILQSYEEAISAGDVESQAAELDTLRLWHAWNLFYSPAREDHAKAFALWQDIIEVSGEESQSFFLAFHTLKTLCRHLLDDAISNGVIPLSPAAVEHMSRLESLCKLDLPIIRGVRGSNNDPILAVACLHTLAGRSAEARQSVLERLRVFFDEWPDASNGAELLYRHSRLAQTFTVLGDDTNAVAAWQLVLPERPGSDKQEGEAVDDESPAEGSDAAAGAERDDDASITADTTDHIKQLDAIPDGQPNGEVAVDAVKQAHDNSNDPNSLDDLVSYSGYGCDGACGLGWKAMGDAYVCRQCFDCQFCAPCHAKLRAGELHITTCNKAHEHLYIPPFDRKAWEERDPQMMVVGGAEVLHSAWLDGLREQWGLRQDRIDEYKLQMAARTRAAKVLTRWRKALLRVRAGTR